MRNKIFVAALFAATISRADFVVMSKDMNTPNDDQHWRRIGILVANNSDQNVRLDTMEAVYFISDTSSSLESANWYFQSHNENWTYSVQGAEYFTSRIDGSSNLKEVHLRFATGSFLPGQGQLEVKFGIHRGDGTVINQSIDPSYLDTNQYTANPRISFQSINASYRSYSDTTILGRDRDFDKVRDDIQLMIRNQQGISDTAKLLEYRLSSNLDSIMISTNPDQIARLWRKYLQLENCFQARVVSEGKEMDLAVEFSNRVFAKQLNTRLRTKAYFDAKKRIIGQVFKIGETIFDLTCMEVI